MKKLILVAAALLAAVSSSKGVVLYNGSLGTAPESQPWLTYAGLGSGITHTTSGSVTTLNTSAALVNYAGYSNYTANPVSPTLVNAAFPTLDPSTGFDLTFTVKLDAEVHSTDRAGFSVILLDNAHQGVELGFQTGQVFAQTVGFTHGESTANFDPTAGTYNYDLHIAGSTYTLSANGNVILTDPIRDYSSFGIPYSLNNYVFFGDDTTSASATTEFSAAAITVPEPTCFAAVSLIALAVRRRR